ncbi:uncharacterized protein LOC124199645 isoform X2 [Daphnia pulex]|uniref:uncharacterized protein LOC124199645 isoform X2 n=1 Tax=Daphnia pulex TaxID=6669 RepID=UPI001EE0F686|nr:uncharacterized protein LOC124199645 isoform X2 [Daphnia pulex]
MSNQLHPIHSLFKFNAESRESKCMVSGCRDSFKGKKTTNLIRHAENKHLEEYVHLMAAHNKNKAQPNTKKTEGMQLRSYCKKVVKEKPATKHEQNKERSRLYSKAYRERIKLMKKQTEDKLKNSSDGDPTSLIEGLSMQQLHATNLDPVCPIPMTLEKNSQMQLQPAALDSQQNQLTVYPNWQETNRISDLNDNLFSETNNNSISSATIPQPSPCSFSKAMSDTTVLLEPNHSEANEIPNGVRIQDVPPLVPIYESFQEASFPTDYAPVEIFYQPYPANIPIEDNSLESSITQVVLSPEAQIMLSEQMRKHVQLLTQMHLITAQQSDLKPVTEGCHSMLQELVPLKERMEIANLDEALDLVKRWETVVTKASSEELRKYQRQVVNYGKKKKFLKCSGKNLERFPFNPKMVEMMAESRIFIYPELLPTLAIFQAERGPSCRMSPHEDQLIAMGIERFTPFNEDYFSGSQKSMSLLICSMISQYILPHRTAKEIKARIKSKCLPTSPDNPIKFYLENQEAPSVHHVIQPFDRYSTRKLSEIPSFLLPSRWREFFSFSNAVDSLQNQPEQNIGRIPPSPNTSSETHIARIPLNGPEVRQKRFVPASTSRKLKSPSKYEKKTRDQRRHKTISKKRRFVQPHEIEIELEEIFIENIKTEFDKGENF